MNHWTKEKLDFNDIQRLMARLIEKVSFFQGLTHKEVQKLLESAEKCTFEAGEAIVRQGSTGAFLYVLIEGAVTVLKAPTPSDGKRPPKELARLNAGDCFGEMSLVDRDSRSASVLALSPCVLIRINEMACWNEPVTSAKIFHNIARTLSRRLRAMDEAFVVGRYGD
jgi:CRP-like cAMP-binding protein